MKINITNKQYEMLIRLLYLGERMVNADSTLDEQDSEQKEATKLFHYMLSFAPEFHLEKRLSKSGMETAQLEQDEFIQKSRVSYDDYRFVDEFLHRCIKQDIENTYSPQELQAFGQTRTIQIYSEIEEKRYKAYNKNGMKDIEITLKEGEDTKP